MLTQNIGTAIPTIVDGGNHTLGFTKAAATIEAHYACLDVSKALASTGVRVLIDDVFFEKVHTNDLFNTVGLIRCPFYSRLSRRSRRMRRPEERCKF